MDSDDFKVLLNLPNPSDGFRVLEFINDRFPTSPTLESLQLHKLDRSGFPSNALFPPTLIHSPKAVGFFTNMENFEFEIRYV